MLLTFTERLLRKYELFCSTTTGGGKAEKEAVKCRGHISYLLTNMDISDVRQLASPDHLNRLETDYLQNTRHHHKANTVVNYLQSLNDFCDFLTFNTQLDTGFTEHMANTYGFRRTR